MNERDLHTLWKNQPTEEIDMNATVTAAQHAAHAAAPEKRANAFRRPLADIRLRDHGSGIAVLLIFTLYFFMANHPVLQVGCVLVLLGNLCVMWRWQQRLQLMRAQPGNLGESWVAFHRQNLINRRDTGQLGWRWALIFLLPGAVIFRWGVALEAGRIDWWTNGIIVSILIGTYAANVRATRRLQAEIDALPSVE